MNPDEAGRPIDPISVDTYIALITSFRVGMVRFFGAEAAAARLMCALLALRSDPLPESGFQSNPYRVVLEQLERIPYSSFDSLGYVTNISHIVYATTLLDTFLTDTTVFLFLLFPEAMGKDKHIPLRTLINSSSVHGALTQAAVMRAREISYLAFGARLQFLGEAFGLRIVLDDTSKQALDHYSGVRNSAVHDQGILELRLEENGRVSHRQKTCPRHPTPLKGEEVQSAADAYNRVFLAVARAVMSQVLKADDALASLSLLPDDTETKRKAPN